MIFSDICCIIKFLDTIKSCDCANRSISPTNHTYLSKIRPNPKQTPALRSKIPAEGLQTFTGNRVSQKKKIKKQSSFAQETMQDSSYFDEVHTHKNTLQKSKKHKNIQKLADDFLHAASLPLLHTATLAAAILPLGLTVLGEGGLP